MRKISASFVALAVGVFAVLFGVAPAWATAGSVSLTKNISGTWSAMTTINPNTQWPAGGFVVTVPTVTSSVDYIIIRVEDSTVKNTCTGVTTPANCGFNPSVTVNTVSNANSLTAAQPGPGAGEVALQFTTPLTSGLNIVFDRSSVGTFTQGSQSGPITVEVIFYDSSNNDLGSVSTILNVSTVSFDANGGAGSMPNQVAGQPTALTQNTFTRSGYTFANWNTSADGTGTAYSDGASYSFAQSMTLYAQWTDDPALAATGKDFSAQLWTAVSLLILGGTFIALRYIRVRRNVPLG